MDSLGSKQSLSRNKIRLECPFANDQLSRILSLRMAISTVISVEKWSDLESKLPTLTDPCLIRSCLSSQLHRENIEIFISSFQLRDHTFVECSSTSWPCCAHSDITGIPDRIRKFYSNYFAVGEWVDQGSVTTPASNASLQH